MYWQANENDTSHHNDLFNVGWPNAPHRVLRNSTVDLWEAKGRPPSGDRPSEGEVIAKSPSHGDIVRYQSYTPGADAEGDIEALSMWAGQGLSLVRKRQPAAEIVEELINDARATLKRVTV